MWAGWGPEAQEAQLSTNQGMIQALAQVCASPKSVPFPQHLQSVVAGPAKTHFPR